MEYISVENQKILARRYKTAVMVVAAIFLTIVLFMIAARLITPREMAPGSESWQKRVYSAVIVIGLVVVILRRFLMSKMVLGGAASRGVGAVLSNLNSLSVICAAAAELIAILGLILYFLTGEYDYSWRLGVVGLVLILYSFPRRGEWERAVVAAAGK